MNFRHATRIGVALLALAAVAAQCSIPAQTQLSPNATPSLPATAAASAAPASTNATTAAPTAILATTAALPTAAATAAATVAAPPEPDVLRVAIPFLATLDPVQSYNVEQMILGNVCERLLDLNPPGSATQYSYKLATALTHSDDGLTWTATLRAGVKFHDGTPLTADAVKRTFDAVRDHGAFAYAYVPVSGIDAPDDHTVVFHENIPMDLGLVLAGPYGSQIVSSAALAAVQADPKAYDKGLDGCTGPYQIKSASANLVELVPYAEYWNPVKTAGRPGTVEVNIVPAFDQAALLQNGQLDLAIGMPNTATAGFKGNPAFTLFAAPTFQTAELFLDNQRGPLDNKMVRQAIAAAIDTDAIIAKMAAADGVPYYTQHGPVPDGLYPSAPDVPANHFDLAIAKQLLAEAGHPGGGIKLRLIYGVLDGPASVAAPLVVQDLAQIGISVNAQQLQSSDFVAQIKSSKPDDRPDIVSASRAIFRLDGSVEVLLPGYESGGPGGLNFSHYKNPAFDQLVDSAFAEEVTDPAAALTAYVQAEKLVVDDAPAVFLYRTSANYALPNYLKGFAFNPNYNNFVDFTALNYAP